MYLIVGLGNPEEQYANTRHNMGFCTINKISEKFNIGLDKTKFNAIYGKGEIEGKKVILQATRREEGLTPSPLLR